MEKGIAISLETEQRKAVDLNQCPLDRKRATERGTPSQWVSQEGLCQTHEKETTEPGKWDSGKQKHFILYVKGLSEIISRR